MLIVHDIFVCKPGNASKVAKMFKESMKNMPEMMHIMTDMTGQFHRVIAVSKYENLAAYEKAYEAYKNPSPEMKEAMAKMENINDMYVSGSREMYQTLM